MKQPTKIWQKTVKKPIQKKKANNRKKISKKRNSKNNQSFYHPGSANQKHIEAEVFWFKAFDLSAL